MAKIRIDAADGLTVRAVMHAKFSALPATATVGDVRDYFAASASRRVAYLVDDERRLVGALTKALVADGDATTPARDVADPATTIGPGAPATVGRDLALRTDSRRVPVVDDDGRVMGVVAVTGDLISFCGTSDAASSTLTG